MLVGVSCVIKLSGPYSVAIDAVILPRYLFCNMIVGRTDYAKIDHKRKQE